MSSATQSLPPSPFNEISTLSIGTPVVLKTQSSSIRTITNSTWSIPPGFYTPKEIVLASIPLLFVVLRHLGPDPAFTPLKFQAQTLLLNSLASTLRTDTREASLKLPVEDGDRSIVEVREQANKVGLALKGYADEALDEIHAGKHIGIDLELTIRSPCEGHIWTKDTAALLVGSRSNSILMQLYNEFLHQMVLLRDSLLPFQNFEDVVIVVKETEGNGEEKIRGMRFVEKAREAFLMELFTRGIAQRSIVKLASATVGMSASEFEDGYGFQYEGGLVLPDYLGGHSSLRLLRYFSAKLEGAGDDVFFQYRWPDYYTAPKVGVQEIKSGAEGESPNLRRMAETDWCVVRNSLLVERMDGKTLLWLCLWFASGNYAQVDVGQVAKGWRYSYSTTLKGKSDSAALEPDAKSVIQLARNNQTTVPFSLHSAEAVLTQNGTKGALLTGKPGLHVVPVKSRLLGLALLGKLYPENIVRIGLMDEVAATNQVGKGFSEASKWVVAGDWTDKTTGGIH